ncbi:MAG: toxin, partial [Deltaproteobacteria bacterium]
KLLSYWDTVADRLFKIRHCMNIEGVVRQLPLFQPPIDPGLLVKAAAAGIDISSLVSGLNQPLMPVRATLLIQKALELAGEVRNMGNSLLSALEKRDAEALTRLRQAHEITIQKMVQDVRYLQWKEAEASTEALIKSRESALERYRFYQRLLGKNEDELKDVASFSLQRRELTEEKFDEVYAELVEQYGQEIMPDEYPSLEMTDEGKLLLITSESDEISHLENARNLTVASTVFHSLSATLTPIPDAKTNVHYWGLGGTIDLKVGTVLATVARLMGDLLGIWAAWDRDQAGITSRTASYKRRADEWRLQSNLAARELMQIGRQIITSLIREQITRHEYETVKKQIEQAREIDRLLHDKFTNEELYGWMAGELSKLYYEYYKFAFDVACKAEQTMKHELMRPELDDRTFIKFNYWDGGRKGLLAGDALHLDIKRMEMVYHEHNLREYELTKHVSLLQVDPLALIQLRTTGRCTVRLPEALFDMDGPGHYFRRIKTVAMSVPCVTGPYAGVNCKLTLLKSSIRKTSVLRDGLYAREGSEDDRFIDYFGSLQSIVTSSGQNDSGLFETSLHDERYLPFENAGVISEWQLELPANPSEGEPAQFDYNTISDVILHIRYTAREGGALLRNAAMQALDELIEAGQAAGSVRLFSIRHEFPTEWAKFTSQTPSANQRYELAFTLRPEHYPFWAQGRLNSVKRIDLLACTEQTSVPGSIDVYDKISDQPNAAQKDTLTKDAALGNLLIGKLTNIALPAKPTGELKLYFEDAKLSDLWLAVTWSRSE